MKTKFRAAGALMLSLSLCGGLLTTAQAAPKTTTAAKTAKADKGQRGGMRMMSELNLTDAQKQKLMPIMKGMREQMKALRDNTSLSPEAKKVKMKTLREANQAKIKAILTPEQQKKMAEMRAKARAEGGKRGEGRRGGKGGPQAPVPAK